MAVRRGRDTGIAVHGLLVWLNRPSRDSSIWEKRQIERILGSKSTGTSYPTNRVENMKAKTAELWAKQNQHQGDRFRLFSAVGEAIEAETVFYPGSYVDIAPSFVFGSVTYLDADKRTPGFFADIDGVLEIIAQHDGPPEPDVAFIHGDYTSPLDLPEERFDLLVSLYAGFISEHCTRYLKVGGTLLANASHGDAAMASIDPRYALSGVVKSGSGTYRVDTTDLDTYLIPKKPQVITAELLHESGRGIGYTKSPFAYLFTRVK